MPLPAPVTVATLAIMASRVKQTLMSVHKMLPFVRVVTSAKIQTAAMSVSVPKAMKVKTATRTLMTVEIAPVPMEIALMASTLIHAAVM